MTTSLCPSCFLGFLINNLGSNKGNKIYIKKSCLQSGTFYENFLVTHDVALPNQADCVGVAVAHHDSPLSSAPVTELTRNYF